MGCIPGFGEHNSGWHPIDITRVGYVTGHFEEKAHVSVKCLLQAIFFSIQRSLRVEDVKNKNKSDKFKLLHYGYKDAYIRWNIDKMRLVRWKRARRKCVM